MIRTQGAMLIEHYKGTISPMLVRRICFEADSLNECCLTLIDESCQVHIETEQEPMHLFVMARRKRTTMSGHAEDFGAGKAF